MRRSSAETLWTMPSTAPSHQVHALAVIRGHHAGRSIGLSVSGAYIEQRHHHVARPRRALRWTPSCRKGLSYHIVRQAVRLRAYSRANRMNRFRLLSSNGVVAIMTAIAASCASVVGQGGLDRELAVQRLIMLPNTPLVHILVDPARFHGQWTKMSGVLRFGRELSQLFVAELDARYLLEENSIRVSFADSVYLGASDWKKGRKTFIGDIDSLDYSVATVAGIVDSTYQSFGCEVELEAADVVLLHKQYD